MTSNTYIYRPFTKMLGIVALVGLGIMLISVLYATLTGSLLTEGPIIMGMPWGLVSIVDLYIGLVLFSFWIVRRESFSLRAMAWVIFVLILGNMISCLYVIKACFESKGNIKQFWLGTHND